MLNNYKVNKKLYQEQAEDPDEARKPAACETAVAVLIPELMS